MFRRVPPVHSPLSLGALARGAAAAVSRRAWRESRGVIDRWVQETFHPLAWAWTDSGTTALTLALRLATAERGSRRIALPAYGCYDLATACDGAEVEVLLYDLNPETLGPDWDSLEWALREGARTIVVAYLYGIPVDLERVRGLATPHGATVIEDAAQGMGGGYNRRPLGSHGDLSILSFGRGKGFSAGGGGLLMTHDATYHEAVRGLELPWARGTGAWAKSLLQAAFSAPSRFWIPAGLPMLGLGKTVYHPPHCPGALSRSGTGMLAGGVGWIAHAVEARRTVATRWQTLLPAGWGIHPDSQDVRPGWLRFPILPPSAQAADVLAMAAAKFGAARGYPLSLLDLPGFGVKSMAALPRGSPGARHLADRLLTLPTHVYVQQRDMDSIAEMVGRLPAARYAG